MEISQNLENNLITSENFESASFFNSNDNKEIINNTELNNFFKLKTNSLIADSKKLSKQNTKVEQDYLNLVDSSSFELTNLNLSNEIINGIKEFEFEAGLEKLSLPDLDNLNYKILRKKTHVQIVTACAHAAYFVGIANRIRRNIEEIKSGITRQKNSMLLNEMKKTPGLQIGIIGCGKLGRQLAKCFMEYSEVYPSDLQISTRQPDLLNEFINKNVRCYYDNKRLINSVNIAFICVLPSQLPMVLNDIKNHLPEKVIIYSLIRPINGMHLRNLLSESICRSFILRPEYQLSEKFYDSNIKWDFSLDIIESLGSIEMISLTNPFNNDEGIIKCNNFIKSSFVYAIINICSFLNLAKNETLNALRSFLFLTINKNFKLEENNFHELKNQSNYLPIVDLVDVANKPSAFSIKLESSKTFRRALNKNFIKYFEEANIWRTRNSIKS